MSFKPEVVADSSGKWTGNALRFGTEAEAQMYVNDLARRWTLVTDTRVVPSDDPVTDVIDLETGVMTRYQPDEPEVASHGGWEEARRELDARIRADEGFMELVRCYGGRPQAHVPSRRAARLADEICGRLGIEAAIYRGNVFGAAADWIREHEPERQGEVTFGELSPEGYTNVRVISNADIARCPHVIFVADHYREDGSCRCDDPEAEDMAEAGYTWSDELGRWAGAEEVTA